jgi:hypothetical protein
VIEEARRLNSDVRITSLSGVGVLSFDRFGLGLSERVTFVVGPNGAGRAT